jgi:chromosome segregation ATPase
MFKEVNKLQSMSGFVGSRAKKRRRNIVITLGLVTLLGIFTFILPKLETNNSEIIPNDSIVPDPTEDLTSLASNIEELELNLFQKDQKIKFRDGQIKNLQTELKNTKLQYDSVILELNVIKDDFSTLSSNNENLVSLKKFKSLQDKFTKLNVENDKNISTIKKLNKKIDELNNNLLLVDEQTNEIKRENEQLKKDNKSFFAKNLKLEKNITKVISDLKQKIIEQKSEINSYLQQIKKLKDRTHHGG